MRRSPRSSTSRWAGEPGAPARAPARRPPPSRVLDTLRRLGPGAGGAGEVPLVLTVGNGGTGKTTVAAALAVALADRGFRVLVASIDPAHNLGDVLESRLRGEPGPVGASGRLWALEVDMDRALERYLERQVAQLQAAYRYLQAFNLEGYLETLRHSPGVEEQAAVEEMARLLELARAQAADVLIVDTPPTGLTLRVLSLPAVSVRWARHLGMVRRALLERRDALERVLGPQRARIGGEEVELPSREDRDPISQTLRAYRQEMEALQHRLQDVERCGVVVVRNQDPLSLLETERALEALAAFAIPVAMTVVNKARDGGQGGEQAEADYPLRRVPLLSPEPMGVEALREVARHLLPEEASP